MHDGVPSLAAFTLSLFAVGAALIALFRRFAYIELGWWAAWALAAPYVVASSQVELGWFLASKSWFLWFLALAMATQRAGYQWLRRRRPAESHAELLARSATARLLASPWWSWLAFVGVVGNTVPLIVVDAQAGRYVSLVGGVALTLGAFLPLFAPIVSVGVVETRRGVRALPFRVRLGTWWPALFTVWYVPFLMTAVPTAIPWAVFHGLLPALACLHLGDADHWAYFRVHSLALTMAYSAVLDAWGPTGWPDRYYVGSGVFGGIDVAAVEVLSLASWLLVPLCVGASIHWLWTTGRTTRRPCLSTIVG